MERLFNPGELFGEQAFADVTIKYSGRELRAHKVILSMRSKYFERAFAVDSGFKEGKERVMVLHGDDPDALETMLRYIYTSNYPLIRPRLWKRHLDIAIVADKYGLDLLKNESLGKLDQVRRFVDHCGNRDIASTLDFIVHVGNWLPGESERVGKLIEKHCTRDFESFFMEKRFRAMLECHTSVRDRLYVEHIDVLIEHSTFSALLREESGLAAKYLKAIVRLHKYHLYEEDCSGCPHEEDESEDEGAKFLADL